MILDKHLDTIVSAGIDAAVSGIKALHRKRKMCNQEKSHSSLRSPLALTTTVDGNPTVITIHPVTK